MNQIELADKIKRFGLSESNVLKDYFDLLCSMEDKSEAHRRNKEVRDISLREGRAQRSGAMLDIYWKSLLFDAPVDFDAYCIYIEKNRPVDKRFYLPRRKRLIEVATALQELEDDKLDLLGISLPPGAGKTTTIKMLTGLTKPTEGEASVGGYHVVKELDEVKKRIGVSPQETAVAPNLSVEENLELICGIHGFSKEKTKTRIKELSKQSNPIA